MPRPEGDSPSDDHALGPCKHQLNTPTGHAPIDPQLCLNRTLRVDDAIIELIGGYCRDRHHDRAVPGRPTREPWGKRNQHAEVMPPSGDVLTAQPGEVADILGEQSLSAVGRGRENVGVRPVRHSQLSHGNGIDALIPQRLRRLVRVHLVEKQLQRVSAAAVS